MLRILGALIAALLVTVVLYRRKEEILPAIFRFLALFLVFLMLSGVRITKATSPAKKAVVLIDISQSMSQSGKFEWTRRLLDSLEALADGKLHFLAFSSTIVPWNDTLNPTGDVTDIAGALVRSPDLPVILISDGYHNAPTELLSALNRITKPVYVFLPQTRSESPDFSISQIEGDEAVSEGEEATLKVYLSSSPPSNYSGKIVLYENGEVLEEKSVAFKGKTVVEFRVKAQGRGSHYYRLYLVPKDGEGNIQNNERHFSLTVTGGLRKAVVIASRPHPILRHIRNYLEGIAGLSVEYLVKTGKSCVIVNGSPRKLENAEKPEGDFYILVDPDRWTAGLFEGKLPERAIIFLGDGSQKSFYFLNLPSQPTVRGGRFTVDLGDKNADIDLPPISRIVWTDLPPHARPVLRLKGVRGRGIGYPLLFSVEDETHHLAYVTTLELWKLQLYSPKAFKGITDRALEIATKGEGQFYVTPAKGVYYQGEPVVIRAYALDERGEPVLDVRAFIQREDSLLPMKMEEPGKFVSPPFFPDTGEIAAKVIFKKGDKTVKEKTVRFRVEKGNLEKYDVGVDTLTLRMIAERSGGKVLNSPGELPLHLKVSKKGRESVPLRDFPYPYFAVVGCLFAEWLIRRLRGLL